MMKGFHHLDRRAGKIAAALQDSDELLKTRPTADLLDVAEITLKKWRINGQGPNFLRVGVRAIRYRRSDINSWLRSRACKFAHEHDAEAAQRSGS